MFSAVLRGGAFGVSVMVVCILACCGCDPAPAAGAPAAEPAAAATASAATGDEILIGHFASMTGAEATWGVSTDAGVRLAVKEENARGGVNGKMLKVITYDNQGKAQESATVVTRLITQDKVVAVVGEVASSRSIAGGQIAQRFGVPISL